HAWPDDALKVVAKTPLKASEWYHVAISYDGSRKAAGVKIYFNGALQDVDVAADKLNETIRTTVPFKIGQRHTSERLPALLLENLRVYERTLTPVETANLAKADRLIQLFGKPADQRTDAERSELLDYWLANLDPVNKDLVARQGTIAKEEAAMKSA